MSIFSFSFLVALTGAMVPGPLLTYTIIRSAQSEHRGYLIGVWVIVGHAVIEMAIILLLLSGFSFVFKNAYTMRIIGLVGGGLLLWFGASAVRSVSRSRISSELLISDGADPSGMPEEGRKMKSNPVVGGAIISMSNPYWWIWWATVGLAFMLEFNVSLIDASSLSAFFIGHEAGDLIWYGFISVLAFYGIRRMNQRFYSAVMICCGMFMMIFGLYLGVSPFFKTHV